MNRSNCDIKNGGVDGYVDLHVHTTYSDGILTPEQVVRSAVDLGLKAIGITDHDCVDAVPPCIVSAEGTGLEVVPGLEISAAKDETEIHVLGYFVDWLDGSLLGKLQKIRENRVERMRSMVELLNQNGVPISVKKVFEGSTDGTIGRLHLARVMTQENTVKNTKEAFDRYIGDGKPCYVGHRRLDYTDAIDMIREAGGVPVLAHPGSMGKDEYIPAYVKAGIRGIEAVHSKHHPLVRDKYIELADEYGLLVTGGSDCHGMKEKDGILIGKVKIGYGTVKALREEAQKIRAANRKVFGSA